MNARYQFSRIIASAATLALLTACGGGGDSSPTSTPTSTGTAPSTAATKYTQAEAQAVVAQGIAATTFGGTHVAPGLAYLGGSLVGFSSLESGSLPATFSPCAGGGSYTFAFTKSAVRPGFAVGDQVLLNYSNCGIGPMVVNGNVTLTLRNAATNLPTGDYDVGYEARFNGYSFRIAGDTGTFSGLANIISQFAGSNSMIQQMSVPVGQTVNVQGNSASIEYKGDSTVYVRDFITPSSKRRGLIGNVDLVKGGKTFPLIVTTLTVLSGNTPPTGEFVASAGFLVAKNKALELNTTTRFNETSASVASDSDGDGTLDLEFNSNWAALTSP